MSPLLLSPHIYKSITFSLFVSVSFLFPCFLSARQYIACSCIQRKKEHIYRWFPSITVTTDKSNNDCQPIKRNGSLSLFKPRKTGPFVPSSLYLRRVLGHLNEQNTSCLHSTKLFFLVPRPWGRESGLWWKRPHPLILQMVSSPLGGNPAESVGRAGEGFWKVTTNNAVRNSIEQSPCNDVQFLPFLSFLLSFSPHIMWPPILLF